MENYLRLLCMLSAGLATTSTVQAGRSWRKPRMALLNVDVQDCFLGNGSLAVSNGNEVIPVINDIRSRFGDVFEVVAFSLDWHPVGHVSFASSHPGHHVYDVMALQYRDNGTLCAPVDDSTFGQRFPTAGRCDDGQTPTVSIPQVLWPDHCVQNVSSGPTSARLAENLRVEPDDFLVKKGTLQDLDSYSAFYDNGQFDQTPLDLYFRSHDITHVFITGLANDYCVFHTSLDAVRLGYETYVVMDASRGVAQNTIDQATLDMARKGVNLVLSEDLEDIISSIYATASGHSLKYPFTTTVLLPMAVLALLRGTTG